MQKPDDNRPNREEKPDTGNPKTPEQKLIPQSYELSPEVIAAIKMDAANTERATNDVVRDILIDYYRKRKIL